MYRRAYVLLVVAAVMGWSWAASSRGATTSRCSTPRAASSGPSWIRLPLLLLGALFLDLVPRTLWHSRPGSARCPTSSGSAGAPTGPGSGCTLVVLGIICFYVIYVSYRNLKSFLPLVSHRMYDRELHMLDRVLFFGHEPGPVLHDLLGTTVVAHVLSTIYLLFVPMVPLLVTVWLVWSRNISFGYWFVTSQCIAWTLGTVSYYALPTLGPGLEYYWLYTDLAHTGTTDLMASLVNARARRALGVDGQASRTGRRLRQPAQRHHAALGADGAVHGAQPAHADALLDQLRPHRRRHHLLRLALRRRRHRRHHDRLRLLLPRRHRHRPEVRARSLGSHPTTDDSKVPVDR